MNRLQTELQRLYSLPPDDAAVQPTGAPAQTRTLLLELARPADWDALGRVWRGVQLDLQLPAPAIAVSGTEGLQLWFSLQQPVCAARAGEFLAALQSRYLAGIAANRLRLDVQAPDVPAQHATTGNWSAFVAPDLAPVFVDTPWLDIPPGVDGQADLLARLDSIKPAAFDAALLLLRPAPATAAAPEVAPMPAHHDEEPRQFLLRVMNDERVDLALRIEAARALLGSR